VKRQLFLIRHAKSDWEDSSLSDFDRPLSARGERDTPLMAERLVAMDIKPDCMISSPAKRARSTAEIIASRLGFPIHDIDWTTELYLASPTDMLDVIRNCPDHVTSLALIGHNPGISTLAAKLSGIVLGNIPTCGIVHLDAKLKTWNEAGSNFYISNFDYPKRKDKPDFAVNS